MGGIVGLFVLGSAFSLFSLWLLRATTRVENYLGVVSGSAHMLVSQELMGITDDRMVELIDGIITILAGDSLVYSPEGGNARRTDPGVYHPDSLRFSPQWGGGRSAGINLITLMGDEQYINDIQLVKAHWAQLKVHINGVRRERLRDPHVSIDSQPAQVLFSSGQVFYELLNSAADSAEAFADRLVFWTRLTIIVAAVFSLVLVVFALFYLNRLKAIAEAATEEITVMKDNMGIGVFLMDKDLVIQPQYSKALESILGDENLAKQKFIDLLSASISKKEQETLVDYFSMIINRSFDPQMLAQINPLEELHFVNASTGAEKDLRCSFALVDQGKGAAFILGTLEDVTSEKMLQKQLSEEADKREEEMRSVFEIVQVEPRVFNEFLEDMEYEFNRINEMLKNRELTSQFAMVDIYQSVHAIKSNAIILDLEKFSQKMQALELEIKKIRDKEKISFEDTLHITVEIEKVMREKDKFRETINRIQSFKISEVRNQDEYVLIQSLSRASGKAARDLGKKVEFTADFIDRQALEHGPRRLIKEVLMQLVRNAVYHGIESPADRGARGKDETGHIRLNIGVENGKIHIILADDGQGLDFNQIREQAQKMNALKNPEDLRDNKHLAQVIFAPGFSTAGDAGLHAGRGIGLSLVRDRLYAVNGSVKLHTEEGKGTTFHIFIPLEQDKAKVS
jgi:two-component system chemotaxis sensor kinase CheA